MMLMMTLKQMSRDTGTNVVLVNNTDVLYIVVLESSNEALEHVDIDEMLDILKNIIKGANVILLLVNGGQERFDASLQQMMREMQVKENQNTYFH